MTVGSLVTLDATASTNASGSLLVYKWSIASKPIASGATLSDSSAVKPTFVVDVDGTYVIRLVVNDGHGDSAADTVTVTSSTGNSAPIANARPDQNVATGSRVTLDGSASSDADGDLLDYKWSFVSKPLGSSAALWSPTSAKPTFVADLDGSYVISLIVNDGKVDSVADTVTVTASSANCPPIANAGPDQNVSTGSLVRLDGSGSHDADGDPLTYLWAFVSKPSGSHAVLSNPKAVNPTFVADVDGPYVIKLIVNDGKVASAPDTVTVTSSSGNSAPIANAGADQSVATGSLVTLDGSASSDADNDPLTYNWAFVSRPAGSNAALSSTTVVMPTFTADVDGSYVVSLVVNDGTVNSVADTVTIIASSDGGGGQCAFVQDGPISTGLGLLPEPDGGIVTVGGNELSSQLLRFDSNASGGQVVATFPGFSHDIAVQPDGNVLVVGHRVGVAGQDMMLLRFDSAGVPDATFGGSGTVVLPRGFGEEGYSVAVQPDGRILAGGLSDDAGNLDVLLVRFNSDGTLDTTFGTGGVVIYDAGVLELGAQDIALQADGKIVVVGTTVFATTDALVLRFNSDGSLDSSFGLNGAVVFNGGDGDNARGVAVQTDGNIVVTGTSLSAIGEPQMLVLRFDANGDPDPSFGSSGVSLSPPGRGNDVAVQSDGKIAVAGGTGDPFNEAALVARFNADGTPDLTFQSGGVFVFNSSGDDFAENVALADDGGIVSVGASNVVVDEFGEVSGQLLLVKLFDVCQ